MHYRLRNNKIIFVAILLVLLNFPLMSGTTDWQVTVLNEPAPGYLKFDWLNDDIFCLWDNYGNKQYISNPQDFTGNAIFKFLNNGFWIADGWHVPGIHKYYLFNQNMVIVDSIPLSNSYILDYHEVEVLSNGHYLVLYMENVAVDMSEIVDGGNPNALITNSVIVETDRTGTVYWVWKALDHIKITDATPDIDLTQPQIDFAHINSFVETSDGNLLISFRHLDEITKVNRTTGDIIWRLGGEKCRNNQFTFVNDDVDGYTGFSHQHSISVPENGKLLLYDNGNLKEPQYSRAVEYSIDETNKTVTKIWEYRHTPDISVTSQGSVCRLPNGNTLINWGLDRITEVKPDKSVAFEMVYKGTSPSLSGIVYRANRLVTRMNAVTKSINSTGGYIFEDQNNITGITLNISHLTGSGSVTVEKHDYSAPEPVLNDSTFTGILPYRWVASHQGIDSIAGVFKLKTASIELPSPASKIRIYKRDKETVGVFKYLKTEYNSGTEEINAGFAGLGEFIACINELGVPVTKQPLNGSTNIPISDTIRWDNVARALGYRVQVSPDKFFGTVHCDSLIKNKTSIVFDGLMYNMVYYIRINAFNDGDTSEWSEVVSFTTVMPGTVKLLNPAKNKVGVGVSDYLHWEGIPGADKYELQVSSKPDFSFMITDTFLTEESCLLTGMNYNTKYYWRVKAFQGENSGPWPEEYYFTTTLPAPVQSYPPNDTTGQPLAGYLFWSTVTGSLSYHLEISSSPDFKSIVISAKNIGDRQYHYNMLNPYIYYYWRVRACRSFDTSAWSTVSRFRTVPVSPAQIEPFNGAGNLQLKLKFNWETITSAVSYMYQLSTDSKFSNLIADTANLAEPAIIVGNLPPNKQLFWRVAARYSDTLSSWSDSWGFITGGKKPPAVPQLLSPVNLSAEYIEGTLKWQVTQYFDNFRVQIAKDKDFKVIVLDTIISDSYEYRYYNLEYNIEYYWRVKSIVGQDSSNWPDAWLFVTIPDRVIQVYPDNELTQVPLDVKFEWKPVAGIEEYNIQVSADSDFNNMLADSSVKTESFLSVKGLIPATYYYWRARYTKNGKFSKWSDTHWFITESERPLDTPILLKPDDDGYGIPPAGSLTWNKVEDAKTYGITVSSDSHFDSTIVNSYDLTENYYNYKGLENNRKYYWRITAFNEGNSSHWSEIRRFVTELKQPINISPARDSDKIPVKGNLMWQKVAGADYYKLQVSKDGQFSLIEIDTTIYGDTVCKYSLSPSTKYYWSVKAGNDKNFSLWSENSDFTTTWQDSGVLNKGLIYLLYPVPASDYIEVEGDISPLSKYEIYSIEGVLVLTGILDSKKINLKQLPPGCYFISLNKKIQCFIKQ